MKLIPLTLQQRDIYYESLLYPGTPVHNIGAKILIKGPLNITAFGQAYEALIHQHDSFRGMVVNTGKVHQFGIMEEWDAPLGWLDLSSRPDPDAAALSYMQQAFVEPFDLNIPGVLHRFCLIKVADDFHYLFSVYHHIITDGWGTSLMFQRLISNYNEIVTAGGITAAYPFSYEDYITDEALYHKSEAYEQDKAYWKNRFATLPDPVIPRRDNTAFTPVSGREELILERALYNRLNELAANNKVSTFHLLLGALAVYLGRCYGSDDLVIGLPVLNRDKAVYKKTVGLFMGVSPLRIQLLWEESFEELTARIRQQLRQDYRHQRFPLSSLLQETGMVQEKNRLYNIALSYEKHNYAGAFHGTETTVIPLTHYAERAALAIYIREFSQEEDVKIDFDYNLHYFDAEGMQRLTRHFYTLLQAIVLNDGRPLKDLPIITSHEQSAVLYRFNPARVAGAGQDTVATLFAREAARLPDKIVLWDEENDYSYQQLQQITGQIAATLSAMHGGQQPIAVMMERSAKMVTVLLGILQSGRPYIPLDPSFPAARLQYILENSRAEVLITDQENIGWQPGEISLLTYETLIADNSVHTASPGLDDTAYIIYTSGSTGNPKGVAVSHRSLANFLVSMQSSPGLTEEEVLFSVTSPSFDISLLEFFLPLITGAAVYIADKETLSDPRKTIATLNQITPTIIQATPGFYQSLFNAGWEPAAGLTVLCGGDLLSTTLTEKLLQYVPVLWNMYGPTETTVWSTTKRILQPEDSNNIGRPINNTDLYILDAFLHPLPVGVTGNIYIGGTGVAKGYYHNDQLTSERFIISPFDKTQRIYFTGDIGKWNTAGEIIFGGRNDTQAKVRGYRIEMEEIEKKLTELPGIDEAVVVAQKRDAQDAFLIGFVKTGTVGFNPDKVITALKTSLPDYMVPRLIVPLTAFPLTPNQKVDRRTLAAWDLTAMQPEGDASPPQQPLERLLATLWQQVLGITVGSIHSDFFRLGGHSIKAVELAALMNDHFGIGTGLKDIFEHPTIDKQVKLLAAGRRTSLALIPLTPTAMHYELAPVQRMMWLACQRPSTSAAYNMYALYDVTGNFSPAAMEQSIQQLIDKHEILRTNFIEIAGIPRQKINNRIFTIQQVVLTSPEELDPFVTSIVTTPFNLGSELLLKAFLIRTGDDQQLFLFTTHHLIMDGWSLRLFVKAAFAAYLQEPETPAPALPFQYRDYAGWSNQQLRNPATALHAAYWQEVLESYVPAETFKRTGREQSFSGNRIYTCFDEQVRNTLYTCAGETGVSVFVVLLAAVHALICRAASQYDFCTGIPVAGRNHPQLQDLPGMFVNTILIRSRLSAAEPFESICHRIKEALFQSLDYQDFPLEEIITAQEKTNTMLFDVMVTWQYPDFSLEKINVTDDLTFSKRKFTAGGSRIPVTFNFYEDDQSQLIGEMEYDTGLYEESRMRLITERFRKLLPQLISQPQTPIGNMDIELDREKELRRNTVEINFEF